MLKANPKKNQVLLVLWKNWFLLKTDF